MKKFDDLSNDEIMYILSLNCLDARNYILKIHGQACLEGFFKRLVYCTLNHLSPEIIIKQNEKIKYFQKIDNPIV